jgi:hypothetical protein
MKVPTVCLLVLAVGGCAFAVPAPHTRGKDPPGVQERTGGGMQTLIQAVGRSGRRLLQFASRIQSFDFYENNINWSPFEEGGDEVGQGTDENEQPTFRNLKEVVESSSSDAVAGPQGYEGLRSEVAGRGETRSATKGGTGSEEDLPETNNTDLDQLHEPAKEPELRVPQHNLQEIYQAQSGREFRGIEGGIVDHANITHLSYMVFKLIKKHRITSVIDMPCRNTLHWFPALLHRLDYEIMNFKYYCVDTENGSLDDIRHLFGDAGSPELMQMIPGESAGLPKTDLIFSWNGPQQWGVGRTWSFFNGIRDLRPKHLMFTNNPGANNDGSARGLLNVRKQPFHVRFQRQRLPHIPCCRNFCALLCIRGQS